MTRSRTVTTLARSLLASAESGISSALEMGLAVRHVADAAVRWERFLANVRILGGDPVLAADLVRRNMANSSDGASRETILARLRLGDSMAGEDSLERNRRAKC